MQVKFNDLKKHHDSMRQNIQEVIESVISASAFVRGEHVDVFEQNFAKVIGSKYCVSCGNGTDALYISMKALGIKQGDEVIVPANSWISSSETITQAGGRPIFCDVLSDTFNIDYEQIEQKITNRTVGILPVHLFGQPVQIGKVLEIAEKFGLWVLEDSAQAHLARFEGKNVGTFGKLATFSFYPGKNLGAMGDAGAIVTNDESLALFAQKFARHGGLKKGVHEIEGINSRMDGIQAAILNTKLPHLMEWTERRREVASTYDQLLDGIELLELPKIAPNVSHAFHLYVVKTNQRDALKVWLEERGVETVINYPCALPFLEAYKYLEHRESDFAVAAALQNQILSLPIYPEIETDQVEYVAQTIREFFQGV